MCDKCSRGKCHSEPTENEPLLIECVSCGGVGCEHCGTGPFEGFVRYSQCPSKSLDSKLVTLVTEAENMRRGILPEAGGSNNQSAWFMNAASFFLSERDTLSPPMF